MDDYTREKAKIRADLIDAIKKIRGTFIPIKVCSCNSKDVGLVISGISQQLLGYRKIAFQARAIFDTHTSDTCRVTIDMLTDGEVNEVLNNTHFSNEIIREVTRELGTFTWGTMQLEAKAFSLGLFALADMRKRIENLEHIVNEMHERKHRRLIDAMRPL